MNAKEFIKSKLTQMVNLFPTIRADYEFDKFDNSHFVQIWPKSLFYQNADFIQWETKIKLQFIELYPYHSLTFTTKGELYEVENPIFTLQGADYQQELAFCFLSVNLTQPYFTNDNQDFMEAFQWQDMGLANCAA